MKIIHLSDLHLVEKSKNSLYGIDPRFRLEMALKSIEKNHSDAEFIAITGDLCDSPSLGIYEMLFNLLSEIKLPVYPILGNHDNREMFLKYFPNFKSGNFVQYSKKIAGSTHIFIDTLVENASFGNLCKDRLAWLESKLNESRDSFVYLYMHHHPISSGMHEMDNDANLKSSVEFWNLLKNYENIKHISFGHLHRIMHSVKQGISLHSTRSTTFQVAYILDDKIEYLTNEENSTYAILDINHDGDVRVHHHEFLNEDRYYLGDY